VLRERVDADKGPLLNPHAHESTLTSACPPQDAILRDERGTVGPPYLDSLDLILARTGNVMSNVGGWQSKAPSLSAAPHRCAQPVLHQAGVLEGPEIATATVPRSLPVAPERYRVLTLLTLPVPRKVREAIYQFVAQYVSHIVPPGQAPS
jgi:hypothetical protein